LHKAVSKLLLCLPAAEKRSADSKSLSEKESAKADSEAMLQSHMDDHATASSELMATEQVIMATHAECDWLMQYFDVRKEARNGELESLSKAKAVLSGADYALLQTRSQQRALPETLLAGSAHHSPQSLSQLMATLSFFMA